MTHARCCAGCAKGTCCELAGSRWANRYCLELPTCTYTAEFCDCRECVAATCQECHDAGNFCCREYELSWCVRGPIFRYPPGLAAETCDPEQLDSVYDLCPDPWIAPDWGITERGSSSEYGSTNAIIPASFPTPESCDTCTSAGANNRVQYRVRLRCESVAGNQCHYTLEGVDYDYEDTDETYTVEGVASIVCGSGSDAGCDGDQSYTHLLVIRPCGLPPAGQPAPPTLTYYATLDKNTPPHTTGVWNLWKVEFAFYCPEEFGFAIPITSTGNPWCETFPSDCDAGYNAPCSEGQDGCTEGCLGDALSMGTLQLINTYPCQDNPCTL